jgi:hypothetical protein
MRNDVLVTEGWRWKLVTSILNQYELPIRDPNCDFMFFFLGLNYHQLFQTCFIYILTYQHLSIVSWIVMLRYPEDGEGTFVSLYI